MTATLHLTPTDTVPDPMPRFFELRSKAAWALSDAANALASLAHRLDTDTHAADAAARDWEEGYLLGYGRRLSRRYGHRRGSTR